MGPFSRPLTLITSVGKSFYHAGNSFYDAGNAIFCKRENENILFCTIFK